MLTKDGFFNTHEVLEIVPKDWKRNTEAFARERVDYVINYIEFFADTLKEYFELKDAKKSLFEKIRLKWFAWIPQNPEDQNKEKSKEKYFQNKKYKLLE